MDKTSKDMEPWGHSADEAEVTLNQMLVELQVGREKETAIRTSLREISPSERNDMVSRCRKVMELTSEYGLSADEIAFMKQMKQNGRLEALMAADRAISPAVKSSQIRDAIVDMNQLTDSITASATALQGHIARAEAAVQAANKQRNQRRDAQSARLKTLKETKAQLESQIVEVKAQIELQTQLYLDKSHSEGRFHDSDKETRSKADSSRGEPFSVELRHYDNLLDKLQSLGSEISHNSSRKKDLLETARGYAGETVFTLVSACATALNFTFCQSLESYGAQHSDASANLHTVREEIYSLVEEIQTLWDEVVPVAHMAVEKELLEPLFTKVNLDRTSKAAQDHVIGVYIAECFDYMNTRLTTLATRLSAALHYHSNLKIAFEYTTRALAVHEKEIEPIPQARFKAHKDLVSGPLFPSTGVNFEIYQDILSGCSQQLNDPLIAHHKKIAELKKFVEGREAKGDDAFRTVQSIYEAFVKASICDNDNASALVLESLVADSLYDSGHRNVGSALTDAQTEESITALQKESRDIDALLGKLNMLATGKLASALRPMFRESLPFLSEQTGHPCSHGGSTSNLSCKDCLQTMKQVEITQRWDGLRDLKGHWD